DVACAVDGARDAPHLRGHADVARRHIKVRMVGKIEELGTELEVKTLRQPCVLHESVIPAKESRAEKHISRRVAERERLRNGERRGVEPLRSRPLCGLRITDDVGAITGPADRRAVKCHGIRLACSKTNDAGELPASKQYVGQSRKLEPAAFSKRQA